MENQFYFVRHWLKYILIVSRYIYFFVILIFCILPNVHFLGLRHSTYRHVHRTTDRKLRITDLASLSHILDSSKSNYQRHYKSSSVLGLSTELDRDKHFDYSGTRKNEFNFCPSIRGLRETLSAAFITANLPLWTAIFHNYETYHVLSQNVEGAFFSSENLLPNLLEDVVVHLHNCGAQLVFENDTACQVADDFSKLSQNYSFGLLDASYEGYEEKVSPVFKALSDKFGEDYLNRQLLGVISLWPQNTRVGISDLQSQTLRSGGVEATGTGNNQCPAAKEFHGEKSPLGF